jgi:DNA polymerase III sliding clamp (beta) subunit (PCNA family)
MKVTVAGRQQWLHSPPANLQSRVNLYAPTRTFTMGNQKSSPVSNYRETRRVSYVVSSRGRKSKAATFSTELCSLNIADVREDTTSSEASVAATSSTLSELFEDNAECSDESEEEEGKRS